MKNTATIGIAALLAGAAGGYLAGKSGSTGSAASAAAESTMRDTKTRLRPGGASSADASKRGPRDTQEALGEAGQMARMQKLMDLYSGMTAAQLEEEAGKLEGLPMAERMMASFLLFARWGEVDPQGALAYSSTLGGGGFFARPTILQSWAATDPANAAKYFSENPGDFAMMGGFGRGGGGDGGASIIAAEWAKLDPDAALAWANTLTGGNKDSALNSIIAEMAGKDPMKAAQVAATLDADNQARAYGEIASRWARTDFAAAESWIQGLPAEARDRAMSEALEVLAGTDPEGAAGKLASMAAGRDRDRAVENIAEGWARKDPAAAAAWVSQQQTDDMDDAMRPVIAAWAGRDSAAALSWIQSQPEGEVRDEAIGTYIWTARNSDPKATMQLAETISDEGDRTRTIFMATRRWMQEDSAAATEYIQSSTAISEEAKQRIIEGGGRGWGGPGGGRGRGGRGGN
jgi:hypothetical protein